MAALTQTVGSLSIWKRHRMPGHLRELRGFVAGVPEELLGEAVEAFVVAAPGVDVSAERILAHCREYPTPLSSRAARHSGMPCRGALPAFAEAAGAQPLGALTSSCFVSFSSHLWVRPTVGVEPP
jgi:acyl-CoA synthetase (AMP-forming)/AMP-acid ligase II